MGLLKFPFVKPLEYRSLTDRAIADHLGVLGLLPATSAGLGENQLAKDVRPAQMCGVAHVDGVGRGEGADPRRAW